MDAKNKHFPDAKLLKRKLRDFKKKVKLLEQRNLELKEKEDAEQITVAELESAFEQHSIECLEKSVIEGLFKHLEEENVEVQGSLQSLLNCVQVQDKWISNLMDLLRIRKIKINQLLSEVEEIDRQMEDFQNVEQFMQDFDYKLGELKEKHDQEFEKMQNLCEREYEKLMQKDKEHYEFLNNHVMPLKHLFCGGLESPLSEDSKREIEESLAEYAAKVAMINDSKSLNGHNNTCE